MPETMTNSGFKGESQENGGDPVITKLDLILMKLEELAAGLDEVDERLTELELTANSGFEVGFDS